VTWENLVLCLVFLLLSPLAIAGLALINQGLGRSRSAAHSMIGTLCALAIAAVVMVVLGAGFAGFKGGNAYSIHLGGVEWDWLGNTSLFMGNSLVSNDSASAGYVLVFLHIVAAGLAAMIPLGAGSDRWRLAPICASSAFFVGFTYPLIAHWVWGGGWLSQLSVHFGGASFVDVGGAGVIQITGGLTALSIVWILGPRRGKYTSESLPTAIPGHNIVLVLFGCILALMGWIGLESATSLLFYNLAPIRIAVVAVNAILSASCGCLAVVVVTQIRYRKPDASLSANGWIAGLVAGSAGCASVSPLAAMVTGAVAGSILVFLIEFLELRLLIDDPGGSISVHAGAGLWGLIAVAVFSPMASEQRWPQVLAQLVGIATFLGFVLPWIHAVNLILNRLVPYRVDRDGDWQGMDIRELGAGAYPEFVVHSEEFLPR